MPTKKATKPAAKKACCKKNCKCVKDTSFKTGLIVVIACIAGLAIFGTYFLTK